MECLVPASKACLLQMIIKIVTLEKRPMSEVTTYYLEMNSPDALNAKTESQGLVVTECKIKQFEYNRYLYGLVGKAWKWTDKLPWTEEQWKTYAEDKNLRLWVAYCQGTPAGYFELHKQKDDIEIAYFGLASEFIGKGWGGYLLSEAIRQAWNWQAARVWVHTCTLDHPSALKNYQSRGMTIYRTEVSPN